MPSSVTISKGDSVTWRGPGPPQRGQTPDAIPAQRSAPRARGRAAFIRRLIVRFWWPAPDSPPRLPARRTNNKGFPHNVVFDEDAIPAGVSADSLSHEDYLNGPGMLSVLSFSSSPQSSPRCSFSTLHAQWISFKPEAVRAVSSP